MKTRRGFDYRAHKVRPVPSASEWDCWLCCRRTHDYWKTNCVNEWVEAERNMRLMDVSTGGSCTFPFLPRGVLLVYLPSFHFYKRYSFFTTQLIWCSTLCLFRCCFLNLCMRRPPCIFVLMRYSSFERTIARNKWGFPGDCVKSASHVWILKD